MVRSQRQFSIPYDAFDRRTIKRLDNDGNGTFEKYWAFLSDGSHEVPKLEDSDGVAAAQPVL